MRGRCKELILSYLTASAGNDHQVDNHTPLDEVPAPGDEPATLEPRPSERDSLILHCPRIRKSRNQPNQAIRHRRYRALPIDLELRGEAQELPVPEDVTSNPFLASSINNAAFEGDRDSRSEGCGDASQGDPIEVDGGSHYTRGANDEFDDQIANADIDQSSIIPEPEPEPEPFPLDVDVGPGSHHSRDANEEVQDQIVNNDNGPDILNDEADMPEQPAGDDADRVEGVNGPTFRRYHSVLNGEYNLVNYGA